MPAKNYTTIYPHTTIREALSLMGSNELRLMIVTAANGKFLGILTDPDLRRGLLKDLNMSDTIESIYQKRPITAHIKDSKDKIFALSAAHNIYEIPLIDDNGHVVRVESVLKIIRPKKNNNKVILMAGGLGTRLRPLTDLIPKPMLRVGNKPILQIIVERFVKQGFSDFIICVNYKSHVIEDYFKDGAKLGANIAYVREYKRLGTAGALSLVDKDSFNGHSFIVSNGDILSELDFGSLLNFHLNNDADATMGTREYSHQIPYGVIHEDNNQIKEIREKPLENYLVSAGIYVLKPHLLDFIPKDEFYDMPSLFNSLAKRDLKLYSFLIKDYWIDIGRYEEYTRANNEFKQD